MMREAGVTRTGERYRVQRQQGSRHIRASFDSLEQANAYSLAVSAAWAIGELPPAAQEFKKRFVRKMTVKVDPAVPTRLDDLVEYAIVTHQQNKHLDPEGVPTKMRGQWRKQGHHFGNPDIRDLRRADVHRFVDHLYAARLSRSTANEYIRLVRMACAQAIEFGLTGGNVAQGVSGRHQDNPLRPRARVQPRPLTPTEVKTLAAQFDPWLRLSVFLMYVACLRLSEVFGLELRDWDPVTQTLRIRRQGGSGKNEGKRDPYAPDEADGRLKTKSSRRTLPLAPVLAEAIDRHIDTFHGSRPTSPEKEEAWLRRRLISTPDIPRPRNTVIVDRWDDALRQTGLDLDTLGFPVNRHFLRKAGSTVIGVGDIRGKLWSGYLGHSTPAEFGGSLTTVQHYFDLPDEELIVVAHRWEEVLRETVGDLVITDEWWSSPHATIQEAATILRVHDSHILWLVRQGHLLLAPEDEVDSWRHRAGVNRSRTRVMISGPSVYAEVDRRARLANTLSEKDAARELGIATWYVKKLRERGLLHADQQESGVWCYERAAVEKVAQMLAEERDHADSYASLAEAASLVGLPQHGFVRIYGDTVSSRTLLVTGRYEYLRADLERTARRKVEPS